MLNIREIVTTKLTSTEQFMFNYIIESFPDNILNHSSGESQEVLLLLLVLTKVLGQAREQVLNMQYAHSVRELIQRISDADNYEGDEPSDVVVNKFSNQVLTLLIAMELGIDDSILGPDVIQQVHNLVPYYSHLPIYYSMIKQRGTLTAVRLLFNAVLATVAIEGLYIDIIEYADSSNAKIEILFDTDTTITTEDWNRLIDAFEDNRPVVRFINHIRPAGVVYYSNLMTLATKIQD